MLSPIRYEARSGTVTWRVRLRVRGRSSSETFPTQKAALKFCQQVEAVGAATAVGLRARTDTADVGYAPSVAQWLEQHIEELTAVTTRTRMDYQAMAARTWLPMIGTLPLDDVDRTIISTVIRRLEKQGLSAKSIANTHGLLSAVLRSAVDAGHLPTNPCAHMRLPRARETERVDARFLTHEEYEALEATFPPQHRPLLVTLFGTGLRWSEVTALQVRDVTLKGRPPLIRVTKAWKQTPGTGREIGPPKSAKSRRDVVLPRQVVEAIEPLMARRPVDAWLFATPAGHPTHHGNWRSRVWVPACADAGLSPAPRIHDARHTHASWLLEQGATLEQVQDQLGHESILTTRKVYGHLQAGMRLALAEAATRALDPLPAID